MNQNQVTIYLVDDHQIIIDGLRLLINNENNLRIVGSSVNGETAYKDILTLKPDIALIDQRMPGMTGIELISSLRKKVDTRFIILSTHIEQRYIDEAEQFGAAGYIIKNSGSRELMSCISKVMQYENCFPKRTLVPSKDSIFTPREREIVKMIIEDFTTQQIASEFHLAAKTIETHRKNIGRKTNTKTAVGLLKYVNDNKIEL